jgi:hypothetical protein
MDSEDISQAIALMERHGIAAFDYESGATELRLRLDGGHGQTSPVEIAPPQAEEPVGHLCSPGVGLLLLAHPASAAAPPPLPRKAAKGEVVAYIKTGMTLRAVGAATDCTLLRILAAPGRGVGYGEALFEIGPG